MPNFSGIWTVTQQMQAKGASTWPTTPGAPTIGTATAGGSLCASVTFTAPACAGYPASVTGYRVISTPGCFTNTGASSPVVVSGLSAGTSYTFKAQATNATGYGALSAASNSITAAVQGQQAFTTASTFTWVAPAGVTSVSVVAVGGGGNGAGNGSGVYSSGSGGGGALVYGNNISVTAGNSYTVFVGGAGQNTYFCSTGVLQANGGVSGLCGANGGAGGAGGTSSGSAKTGGGNGGAGGGVAIFSTTKRSAGGGAGGYTGNGGNGLTYCGSTTINPTAGSGGGGGGARCGYCCYPGTRLVGSGGGGVGLFGLGSSGGAGCGPGASSPGGGGSSGSSGTIGAPFTGGAGGNGGQYGGGGGGAGFYAGAPASSGGVGAVRIIWPGTTRSFPSTNTGNL